MYKIAIAGFSIMQYLFMSFWTVLMSRSISNPNYTNLCRITLGLLKYEPTPNVKAIAKVEWLLKQTHQEVGMNLAMLEVIALYHISKGSGLNKELDIDNKTYKIIDIFKYMDEPLNELVGIMIDISKKYSLEIPFNAMQGISGSGMKW